jgi:vacuolar-type H+-ATPase subunit E/Vma4
VHAAAAVGDAEELAVARQDEALARSLALELGLRCSVRGEGERSGTVVAGSPEGLRRVDNTLSTRLERARDLIEPEISRLLFHD